MSSSEKGLSGFTERAIAAQEQLRGRLNEADLLAYQRELAIGMFDDQILADRVAWDSLRAVLPRAPRMSRLTTVGGERRVQYAGTKALPGAIARVAVQARVEDTPTNRELAENEWRVRNGWNLILKGQRSRKAAVPLKAADMQSCKITAFAPLFDSQGVEVDGYKEETELERVILPEALLDDKKFQARFGRLPNFLEVIEKTYSQGSDSWVTQAEKQTALTHEASAFLLNVDWQRVD